MRLVYTLLLTAAVAAGTAYFVRPTTGASAQEPAFERVMATGTLRCGYFSWDPGFIVDPNTGEKSGIFYDYTTRLGEILNLKIEWVEEVALGEYPAALRSQRIDAFCSAMWPTGARARGSDFLTPIYYLPLYAYTRLNDKRFSDNASLNDATVKMAVLEGGATQTIQKAQFPKAKAVDLPQMTSPAELFVTLAHGKADAVIYDRLTFSAFDRQNPGQITQLGTQPVKLFANTMAVGVGENKLRRLLDHGTRELLINGQIDAILQNYIKVPGAVMPVAKPFQEIN